MQKRLVDAALIVCSVLWSINVTRAAPTRKPASKIPSTQKAAPKKSPAKKVAPKPTPTPTPIMVPLNLKLPRPRFTSEQSRIPYDFKGERPTGKPRPTLYVPEGTTNLALNKPVTASDNQPIIGTHAMVTDGNKEFGDANYVEYGWGKAWAQIDLTKSANIYAILLWHDFEFPVIYRDVVVQISDDVHFVKGVKTVFNNDDDNSSRLGKGSDLEYFELAQGKLIPVKNVKGRYVRFYSNGHNYSKENRYTEIEIYGQ